MRPSRGMGIMNPDKMPGTKGKTIVRKDKPQFVKEYKKGGKVKKAIGYCDACDRTVDQCVCGMRQAKGK